MALSLAAPLISILLFLATGEVALRLIYRDAGRRTLGGPGGGQFEHLYVLDNRRGRFDDGPRRQGVPRLMIFGDSVTWGQGVRDWSELWPERLAQELERGGTTHEMAVLALPGRNISDHLAELRTYGRQIDPDVVIYQWHPNDLEVTAPRPLQPRPWQRWAQHDALRSSSYLYYFLDNRLAMLMPSSERSYVDYLLGDFVRGTLEWAEFERYFHSFATMAAQIAPKRLLVLYPQVPFDGEYPLRELNERMKELAGPHTLICPPSAWWLRGASLEPRPDAVWRRAAVMKAGAPATLDTEPYFIKDGLLELDVVAAGSGPPSLEDTAAFEIVDVSTGEILHRVSVDLREGDGDWERIPIRADLTGKGNRDVRFRFASRGVRDLAFASLEMPVDYGFGVVDLTGPLNAFDTHASIFDAHPNERAHGVIAAEVLNGLKGIGFTR